VEGGLALGSADGIRPRMSRMNADEGRVLLWTGIDEVDGVLKAVALRPVVSSPDVIG
jgi:hypothetical protein